MREYGKNQPNNALKKVKVEKYWSRCSSQFYQR